MGQTQRVLVLTLCLLLTSIVVNSESSPEAGKDIRIVFGNLSIPAWDDNEPSWTEEYLKVGQLSCLFTKPVTDVRDWADDLIGPDAKLLIWFITLMSYVVCVSTAVYYAQHIKVVTARVCALGALVGSPAVFFLARAIVSACSYLANPWTGWPFWTQTHEGAFVMYLAGTMLCIKAIMYLDRCQAAAAPHCPAKRQSSVHGHDATCPTEHGTVGDVPDKNQPNPEPEQTREEVHLQEAAPGATSGAIDTEGPPDRADTAALQANLGTETRADGEGFSAEIAVDVESRPSSAVATPETLNSGIAGHHAATSKPQNKRQRRLARKSAKLAADGGSVAVEAEKPQAHHETANRTRVSEPSAIADITFAPQQPRMSTPKTMGLQLKTDSAPADSPLKQQPARANRPSTSPAMLAPSTAAPNLDQQSHSPVNSQSPLAATGAVAPSATQEQQSSTAAQATGNAASTTAPAAAQSSPKEPVKVSSNRPPAVDEGARNIIERPWMVATKRRSRQAAKNGALTSPTTQKQPAAKGSGRTAAKKSLPAQAATQHQQQQKGPNVNSMTTSGVIKAVVQGSKAPAGPRKKTHSKAAAVHKTAQKSSGGSQATPVTSVPTPLPPHPTPQTPSRPTVPLHDAQVAPQTSATIDLDVGPSSAHQLPDAAAPPTYAEMAITGLESSSGFPGYNPADFEEDDARLVRDEHPLQELIDFHAENSAVKGNLLWLVNGKHSIRRYRSIAGDGNCGYRAFMVGMITSAFNSPKTRALLVQTFPKVLHSINRWGFMDGGRRENIQKGASQLMELLRNKGHLPLETLLDACRHEPGSDCKLLFIRAATAAGLRHCRNQLWCHIQCALEGEDKRHSSMSLQQFCVQFILPMVDASDAETRGLRQFDDWCPAALAHMFGVNIHIHDSHQQGRDDPCKGGRNHDSAIIRLLRQGQHYDLALV